MRFLLFFLYIIVCVSGTFAQNLQILPTRTYGFDEGLSQISATAIIQDRKGFIWVGTQNGLNRFDGYTFKIFLHNPYDTTSICDINIFQLFEDSNGFIWVSTYTGGLSILNPETEKFRNYYANPNDSNSLINNTITVFHEDSEDTIWIGSPDGLGEYKPTHDNFDNYSPERIDYQFYIHSISEINNEQFCISVKGKFMVL